HSLVVEVVASKIVRSVEQQGFIIRVSIEVLRRHVERVKALTFCVRRIATTMRNLVAIPEAFAKGKARMVRVKPFVKQVLFAVLFLSLREIGIWALSGS